MHMHGSAVQIGEIWLSYTGWAKKKLRQIFLAITLVNMDRF